MKNINQPNFPKLLKTLCTFSVPLFPKTKEASVACMSKHLSSEDSKFTREMPTKTNTLEDHDDDDDSDDELLEMHNYHVDFLPLLSPGA